MEQLSFSIKPSPKTTFFIAFYDDAPNMTPVSCDGNLLAFAKERDARDRMGPLGVVVPSQYGSLGDLLKRYQLTGIEISK